MNRGEVEIPSSPPKYAVKITRYVDGDLRRETKRLQFAINVAKHYHDDWPPMVEAAAVARHENTLSVPIARMVLNWARTQAVWMAQLEQMEWDLLDFQEREATVIDLEQRAQNREIRRREAQEARKHERSRFVRTQVKVKAPLLVARQNGKVLHRVDPWGDHKCDWRKYVYGTRGAREGFFDELGMAYPPSTLYVQTICKKMLGFADPLLYSYDQRPDMPICRSGCWSVREDQ